MNREKPILFSGEQECAGVMEEGLSAINSLPWQKFLGKGSCASKTLVNSSYLLFFFGLVLG